MGKLEDQSRNYGGQRWLLTNTCIDVLGRPICSGFCYNPSFSSLVNEQ